MGDITVAMSANFIDRTNVALSIHEADLLGLVAEDPQHVAAALREAQASGLLDKLEATAPSEHSTLRDFKARHGESLAPFETQRRLAWGAKAMVVAGAGLCGVGAYMAFRRRAASAPTMN